MSTLAASCLLRRADLVPAELEELRLGEVLEGDVQAVDPGHGGRGRIVVRVPVPAGLRQEVTAAHRDRVAADDRPHALAFQHETERVLRVPVLGCVLPRHQVLDRRPQRRRGERAAVQPRVGEGDRAALAAPAHRDKVAGLRGQLDEVVPAPPVRQRLGPRVERHEVADFRPQRDQQFPLKAPVKAFQRRRHRGLVLRRHRLQMDRRFEAKRRHASKPDPCPASANKRFC